MRWLEEIKDLYTSELSAEEIDRLMKAQALGLISDGSSSDDDDGDDPDDPWRGKEERLMRELSIIRGRCDGYFSDSDSEQA